MRWIWRCLPREDREQQGKHDNTSRDEGQKLPEREPDATDASPDHEHDEQEEERDQRRHVFFFPQRARAGPRLHTVQDLTAVRFVLLIRDEPLLVHRLELAQLIRGTSARTS